jgi:hypothetical protein
MTARHSPLFTLRSGQSGLRIYTSERDAAFDGRPKSMYLTILTSNQAAMAYAFSQDLVDEDLTIEISIRDYLQCQDLSSESVEALFDEFMVPQANLKQAEGGHLIVHFGDELIGA